MTLIRILLLLNMWSTTILFLISFPLRQNVPFTSYLTDAQYPVFLGRPLTSLGSEQDIHRAAKWLSSGEPRLPCIGSELFLSLFLFVNSRMWKISTSSVTSQQGSKPAGSGLGFFSSLLLSMISLGAFFRDDGDVAIRSISSIRRRRTDFTYLLEHLHLRIYTYVDPPKAVVYTLRAFFYLLVKTVMTVRRAVGVDRRQVWIPDRPGWNPFSIYPEILSSYIITRSPICYYCP